MRIGLLAFVGPCAVVVGCATILHGTTQQVSVNSVPSGASVTVQGVGVGTTPAAIRVHRGDSNVTVRIVKDGYEPVEVILTRSLSGWLVGNILFGGLIGLVVDFASGGAYNISPDYIQTNMQAIQGLNQTRDYPKAFVLLQIEDENR